MTKWNIILTTVAFSILAVILFANLKNTRKKISYSIDNVVDVSDLHFSKILGELLGPSFLEGNKIRGLYNGEEIFPAMLKAIHSAQKTITFESYIYWSGQIGKDFANALSDRARAGVKVHILLDWVGSGKIDKGFIDTMRDAGVEVEYHQPLKWYNLTRMNNRTHRKLLVVDGRVGFTGGVGIADEWDGNGLKEDRWRDSHFEVEGPVVNQIQSAFMDNWLKNRPEVLHSQDYFPDLKNQGQVLSQMFISSSQEGGSSVRIMYLLAIAAAKKSILLESAYFIPDERTIDDLIKATQRGVQVEIIVPGEHVDSFVSRHASRELWGRLLDAGVKIFEYKPALFHCKVFIVDNLFVSVGSTNFDDRSFRLNDEANLNILDRQFADSQTKIFESDRSRSRLVTLENWQSRPWHEKIMEKLSGLLRTQL